MVSGERLPGAEGESQDFVLVNGPAFAAPTPKAFLANLKLLAKTTDKAEGVKKALSAFLRTAETALEAAGGESAFFETLGGARHGSIPLARRPKTRWLWHGLAAHRPLGGVNRARKDPYKFSADYRGRFNGCPMHEPLAIPDLGEFTGALGGLDAGSKTVSYLSSEAR